MPGPVIARWWGRSPKNTNEQNPRAGGAASRHSARGRVCRWVGSRWPRRLVAVLVVAGWSVAAAAPAWAASPTPTLNGVIDALRTWLVGLLAGVATLFLTIGGIRYITAGGDPAQVERAKTALRSAAVGYALAALAPVLVSILTSVVGG